jgi:hypothetical protein
MYDNKEHEKFNSPRYKLTHQGVDYRSYLDLQTGIGYCLPWYDSRRSSKSGYNIYVQNTIEESIEMKNSSTDTILNRYDNIIELIVGVSIAKRGIFRLLGAHAFLMYIVDPYNSARKWQNDIMLDASGHYGVPQYRDTRSDIVFPSTPTTISIDSYRRYFYTRNNKEILYTYSFIIDDSIGKNIRTLILNNDQRSTLSCATKASTILSQVGLFSEIKISSYPVDIKKYFDRYSPNNKMIIDCLEKSSYDLDIYERK